MGWGSCKLRDPRGSFSHCSQERGRDRAIPQCPQKEVALPKPWDPPLQNCETINFCCPSHAVCVALETSPTNSREITTQRQTHRERSMVAADGAYHYGGGLRFRVFLQSWVEPEPHAGSQVLYHALAHQVRH